MVVLSSICFILHSFLNLYNNFINSKTVDITSSVNLSSISFPLQIQFAIEQNINTTKLSELGLQSVFDLYAPLKEANLATMRDNNVTGKSSNN